jgi:hypothetical protein
VGGRDAESIPEKCPVEKVGSNTRKYPNTKKKCCPAKDSTSFSFSNSFIYLWPFAFALLFIAAVLLDFIPEFAFIEFADAPAAFADEAAALAAELAAVAAWFAAFAIAFAAVFIAFATVLLAFALAAVLVFAASPHAIPSAPSARTDESAITFFIEIDSPVFFKG